MTGQAMLDMVQPAVLRKAAIQMPSNPRRHVHDDNTTVTHGVFRCPNDEVFAMYTMNRRVNGKMARRYLVLGFAGQHDYCEVHLHMGAGSTKLLTGPMRLLPLDLAMEKFQHLIDPKKVYNQDRDYPRYKVHLQGLREVRLTGTTTVVQQVSGETVKGVTTRVPRRYNLK